MTKLVRLVRAAKGVSAPEFAEHWKDEYSRLWQHAELTKAVHHHVLPIEVRADTPATASMWSGIGAYYYESKASAHAALVQAQSLAPDHIIVATSYLLCNEVMIFDKHVADAPIKMIAFFKRLPHMNRREALAYYNVDHAAIANNKHNPIVKYVQNHVIDGYDNPDQTFAYDGGPESWFRSLDEAKAFFGHVKSMEVAARDEERFVIQSELAHFYTDEVVVYERAGKAG
jgi:hypothetical protein